MSSVLGTKPLPAVTLAPVSVSEPIAPSGDSSPVCQLAMGDPAAPTQQVMQVRIGNRALFPVPNSAWMQRVVARLKQSLEEPEFEAEQIRPAQVNGMPAIKVGDRAIVTLTPDIVRHWTCNAEQLSLHWINRLRLAFGKVPMDLTSVQKSLYNLREGSRRLQFQASWYGPYFHGRQTATGEIFNQGHFTAAHPFLPFDTYLKVTNRHNQKSVIVRINDRGPYFGNRNLDLSWESARAIGSERDGVVSLDAVIMESDLLLRRTELAIASSLP